MRQIFSLNLVGYLLGIPILGYSLDIGKEHVNLIDEKLEKLIYSGQLDAKELDRYSFENYVYLLVYSCLVLELYYHKNYNPLPEFLLL